jgi:hypothetical protein
MQLPFKVCFSAFLIASLWVRLKQAGQHDDNIIFCKGASMSEMITVLPSADALSVVFDLLPHNIQMEYISSAHALGRVLAEGL